MDLDTSAKPYSAPAEMKLAPSHTYWPDPFPSTFSQVSNFHHIKGWTSLLVSVLQSAVNLKVLTCTIWSCKDGISQAYHYH